MSVGRIQVHRIAAALPGKCCVCGSVGSHDDRQFVDFGFDLDFFGVVYFCTYCMGEVARGIGYIDRADVIELETRLKSNELALRESRAKCTDLRIALDALTAVGRHVRSIEPAPVPDASDVVQDDGKAPSTSADDADGTDESTDESGSSDIQRTPEGDGFDLDKFVL